MGASLTPNNDKGTYSPTVSIQSSMNNLDEQNHTAGHFDHSDINRITFGLKVSFIPYHILRLLYQFFKQVKKNEDATSVKYFKKSFPEMHPVKLVPFHI